MGLGFFMVLVAVIMELTRVRSKVQGKASELPDGKAEQGAQQELALPDVDADGSDDEEEDEETVAVNALQNVEEAQKKMKHGLSMRFAGDDFERKRFEDSYPKSKRRGAVILAMVAAGMILDRVYSIHELSTCSGGSTQMDGGCGSSWKQLPLPSCRRCFSSSPSSCPMPTPLRGPGPTGHIGPSSSSLPRFSWR
mmetsp:Transcript_65049/g.152238  ORF Transcript_65049/g.152238 Transcript_65049/m.152238 type:complete len:195 (+) Transcript_65049:348-932(+)